MKHKDIKNGDKSFVVTLENYDDLGAKSCCGVFAEFEDAVGWIYTDILDRAINSSAKDPRVTLPVENVSGKCWQVRYTYHWDDESSPSVFRGREETYCIYDNRD